MDIANVQEAHKPSAITWPIRYIGTRTFRPQLAVPATQTTLAGRRRAGSSRASAPARVRTRLITGPYAGS